MKTEPEAFIFNPKHNSQQVLKILKALKQASHQLHQNPNTTFSNSPAIKALLELEHESDSILSNDPHLTPLSTHLTALKTLINSPVQRHNGLKSFIIRRVNSHEISKLAGSIESEIDRWIGRELVETLTQTLRRANELKEEVLIDLIEQFEERIARGFDRDLQDSILRSKVFNELESILCDSTSNSKYSNHSNHSKNVREAAAFAITELIRFNKDVFVGQVLIGETEIIHALIELSSVRSLQALGMLIRLIKSPIVDEIESNGEIVNIIDLLTCNEMSVGAMAMECVMEIGYFGRKEAVEAMLKADLVQKLVELQRNEMQGPCPVRTSENNNNIERHPFSSCVARFAVQLEVGEGLRRREKRALKQEVLKRVRDACVCEAEAATIIAEVLWGASP
ncbi:putative armadillo-like helical protein [Helianthus annuus]|nr:putative armadillo-like helical protein [Helianthus annuus]